jgi:hypothetical protein
MIVKGRLFNGGNQGREEKERRGYWVVNIIARHCICKKMAK